MGGRSSAEDNGFGSQLEFRSVSSSRIRQSGAKVFVRPMKRLAALVAFVIGGVVLADTYYRYVISVNIHREMLAAWGLAGYWLALSLPAVLAIGPLIYLVRGLSAANLAVRLLVVVALSVLICALGLTGRTLLCIVLFRPSCI